jgi:hypothetical protein
VPPFNPVLTMPRLGTIPLLILWANGMGEFIGTSASRDRIETGAFGANVAAEAFCWADWQKAGGRNKKITRRHAGKRAYPIGCLVGLPSLADDGELLHFSNVLLSTRQLFSVFMQDTL